MALKQLEGWDFFAAVVAVEINVVDSFDCLVLIQNGYDLTFAYVMQFAKVCVEVQKSLNLRKTEVHYLNFASF